MSCSESHTESSVKENEAATTTLAKARRRREQIEIDVLKAKILDMPEITERMPVEQRRKVADAKRSLWNKDLERAWILEGQRVRECVDKAKELGLIGPPDAVECPFCFDDMSEDMIKAKAAADGPVIFPCCGKTCCHSCCNKLVRTNSADTCPFCRSKLGISNKEAAEQSIKRAQKGDATSQWHVGSRYANGDGVAKDINKARSWFKCAALQGNTGAQGKLGMMYMEGCGGEQSYSEAERFLKMAAKKSCSDVQHCLGKVMRIQGRNEEALQWFTLSAAQGLIDAQNALAFTYFDKGTKSIMLYFYWRKKLALAGDENSFYPTAKSLLIISVNHIDVDGFDFSTMVKEVGNNPIPEVLFWLRKATTEKAAEEVQQYERLARERCSGCWELAESFNDKLKACRCHAAFYCSKKCQIDHWKGGHVLDCWDKHGKFRPCPNNEKYS